MNILSKYWKELEYLTDIYVEYINMLYITLGINAAN